MNENLDVTIKEEISKLLKIDEKSTAKTKQINHAKKKTILVLSGGGIKGIAHIGALRAIEELGHSKNITTFAGSSVGAIIASLALIGYTSDEMYNFILLFDIGRIKSIDLKNLLTNYGLDNGIRVEIMLAKLFDAKGFSKDCTFSELYNKTKKTLIVTASCINDKKVYNFSHIETPDVPVLIAVRMSMSIPLYFVPVIYKGKMYVDGGCMDNFPIRLFDNKLDEVIGIYLSELRDIVNDISNVEEFFSSTLQCMFEGVKCNALKGYEKYTIKIDLDKISIIDFQINNEIKKSLFDTGYRVVIDKLT
jgi:NTE family protein